MISREEAIEIIKYASAFNSENSPLTKALDMAIEALSTERPKGRWECGIQNGADGYWCSNCHAGFSGINCEWIAKEHDFCPKCGSDMRGEEE